MASIIGSLGRVLRDRRSVTALEYGLIAALIAVVSIAGIRTVGQQAKKAFETIGTEMTTANGP